MESKLTFDVLIIGGGVAGCAVAIALKNDCPNLKVAIIERSKSLISISVPRIGETLPPQTAQQLQNLGIWQDFLACNFKKSYGTAASWGSKSLHCNEYIYSPFGYGWHLDRTIFDKLMVSEAKKRGVDFFFNTRIISSEENNNGWQILCKISDKHTVITSKFVVDATGKKAAFASLQGSIKNASDNLVGIYRFYDLNTNENVSVLKNKGSETYVETDENGWWYSATIPNNKLVVAYMTDGDIANKYKIRKSEKFDIELSKTTHTIKRLVNTQSISAPKVVAAHTQYLSSVVGNSWLCVGDAAISFDPISSLGIFKSLRMSKIASYAIRDMLKGDASGLVKYQKLIDLEFEEYKKKKHEYYLEEKRFKTNAFWKRRQLSV